KRKDDFTTTLFGSNTYVFSPEDDPAEVNRILDEIWEKQEANQFGKERYAVYFLPGEYDSSIDVKVGFYTQVSGLGEQPSDTKIPSLNCTARWLGDDSNHNACCNFWRGVENLEVESNTMWAVSQATFMRRTSINGALYLHDNYGWCSGGFLADSKVSLMIDSGSQQQWLSRNNEFKTWMGDNWNLVFVGDKEGCDPTGTWPVKAYTSVKESPEIREKPYLIYDEKAGYQVVVPALRTDASGISWGEKNTEEKRIPIKEFYVANPMRDTAKTLNEALSYGKNIIFTPGIYQLDEAIKVEKKDTVLLGMGLATLEATDGNACIVTSNEEGIILAGLLFDAGEKESKNLLVIGKEGNEESTAENPISLSDIFFRVGGTDSTYAGKVKECLAINASHVIGDNFWVWRADHGDMVGWDENTADSGMTVNGDDVTIYALMVEHFEKYQTIWNGENGKVFMYQSELPYDVPEQSAWMSKDGTVNGYASFYVDDAVKQFEAWGLGIYSYHRDAVVDEYSAMVVPDTPDVRIHNICTVMITGNPGISHVINDSGDAAVNASDRPVILEYADGIQK
ncbi:MAG: sialidase, partial [Lachnospiraceae bacterium]|nr:sialidase [Lachnospiraceae bacterium]